MKSPRTGSILAYGSHIIIDTDGDATICPPYPASLAICVHASPAVSEKDTAEVIRRYFDAAVERTANIILEKMALYVEPSEEQL